MSASARVEITQEKDGWFKAVDEDTGMEIRARSKIEALVAITSTLQALDDVHKATETIGKARDATDKLEAELEAGDTARELRKLIEAMDEAIEVIDRIESRELLDRYERVSASVQQRAHDENVNEDVVSEAIKWARKR